MTNTIVIGIDPGVKTGFATYSPESKTLDCETTKIHTAFIFIKTLIEKHGLDSIFVRVEDARLRTWFGKTGKERMKGAGSISRDSSIWEDFLKDIGVSFEMVHPKHNTTKLKANMFKMLTGYSGRTSEHARDAAMLCYKFNPMKNGKTKKTRT